MTYTHLTTNELVTIEAYYQENIIKIITTRLTGGLIKGYKPIIPAIA